MSVLMEFAMFPTDKGESVSLYVSRIITLIRSHGYSFQLTAMGTIVETETLDQALQLIQSSHDLLEKDCNRIYSTIKFDIRKGRKEAITEKTRSIENIIGKINN